MAVLPSSKLKQDKSLHLVSIPSRLCSSYFKKQKQEKKRNLHELIFALCSSPTVSRYPGRFNIGEDDGVAIAHPGLSNKDYRFPAAGFKFSRLLLLCSAPLLSSVSIDWSCVLQRKVNVSSRSTVGQNALFNSARQRKDSSDVHDDFDRYNYHN